ncbi:MAG: DUF4065 domain-containing protein [Acidobacteria bacterium]|nr:DUF4065 domain-containing protein [Acidobacteriota bacterium]
MANAFDVAAYILSKTGAITTMKLQKLVYYSQAWSLVWDDAPLFSNPIQAWANGPVVPDLYFKYKGQYKLSSCEGNVEVLTPNQKETVDSVLKFYGDKTSQWLSDLTHREDPWLIAREGLSLGERGDKEITLDDMLEYYSKISLS